MSKYWKIMGEFNGTGTSWAAFAGGAGASPYRPVEDAKLVALRTIASRDAATSLTNAVGIRLTSTSFQPNTIEVCAEGGGLQTAPVANPYVVDYEVDQEVKSGVEITLEAKNITADTPVTPNVLLLGYFDNAGRARGR